MSPRFTIHAGFHKTGTTTLQLLLRKNKALLSDHAQILLRDDMLRVCTAARGYSATKSALDLGLVQYELAEVLEGLPNTPQDIILSSEDLAGYMPGRRNVKDYAAAPPLMMALADTILALHPGAEITFFFTTRAAQPWLRSCYAQHLKVVRMVMSGDDYMRDFAASADLDQIVDAVAAAVPQARVDSIALETAGPDRLGPLDTLLSLANIPQAICTQIAPVPRANTAPDPEVLTQLLALNRSDLDKDTLAARKKALTKPLKGQRK